MKRLFYLFLLALIFLSGCGGRDLSNVKSSLYGHWEEKESGTHYYVRDGYFTKVNNDQVNEEYSYKILEHDEIKNLVQIHQVNIDDNSSVIQEIVFNTDERESAEVTFFVNSYIISHETESESNILNDIVKDGIGKLTQGMTFTSKWSYIDNKEKP